jgi:hypothetical protein
MKFALILFLSFFSWFIPVRPSTNGKTFHQYHSEIPTGETVYICNGTSATKYHKTNRCGGLSNCRGTITSIDKSDAIKKGRTECLRCW